MLERRRSYFGFDLDTEVEPIEGNFPPGLEGAARDVLTTALIHGETTHPDQGRVRRSIGELDELWRRSGGTLGPLAPDRIRTQIREQLESVTSWETFLRTRITLEPSKLLDQETRERLDALPSRLHVRGDAVPVDYEIEDSIGVARIRLREGQAKRLRPDDLPR
jgi:hypothetical protein